MPIPQINIPIEFGLFNTFSQTAPASDNHTSHNLNKSNPVIMICIIFK